MPLENLVEKLVLEYEAAPIASRLYPIVSAGMNAFNAEQAVNGDGSHALSALSSLFGKGHIPYRFMFSYLAWRLPQAAEAYLSLTPPCHDR